MLQMPYQLKSSSTFKRACTGPLTFGTAQAERLPGLCTAVQEQVDELEMMSQQQFGQAPTHIQQYNARLQPQGRYFEAVALKQMACSCQQGLGWGI